MKKFLFLVLFLAAVMPGIQCPECTRPAFYFTRWIHTGERLRGEDVIWPDGRAGINGELIQCYWCPFVFESYPSERMEKWFDTKTLKVRARP